MRLIWAGELEIFLFPLLGWLVCFFSSCKATSVQEKKVFLNADRLLGHPMASGAGNLRKENTECNKVSNEYAIAGGARNFLKELQPKAECLSAPGRPVLYMNGSALSCTLQSSYTDFLHILHLLFRSMAAIRVAKFHCRGSSKGRMVDKLMFTRSSGAHSWHYGCDLQGI